MLDAGLLFLIALVGGCLPMVVKWTDRLLHAILALSCGIFLGAVFLHLLPTLSGIEQQLMAANGHVQEHGHAHGPMSLWFFVLVGVVGVYLIEALFLRSHHHDEDHHHKMVGYAALLGLSIHGLTAGLGVAMTEGTEARDPIMVSLLAHKGAESFSLATVFLLARFRRRRILTMLVLFSLVTPAGILIGEMATESLGDYGRAVLTALASGTFLYVCLSELLPEVFHHKEDVVAKISLLALGVVMMVWLH